MCHATFSVHPLEKGWREQPGCAWAGLRATMDYFEEPKEWSDKAEASDASVELVMLLTKNMTRVMDLFKKVSLRRCL